MRSARYWMVAAVGIGVGVAAGHSARDQDDSEPPYLVRLNVMRGRPVIPNAEGFAPDRFPIAVGDWIELSASLPGRAIHEEETYPVEAEIRGEAIEQFAELYPARFIPVLSLYSENVHLFLRARKAGKATIKTTVSRSDTWQETREFVVDVMEKRGKPDRP